MEKRYFHIDFLKAIAITMVCSYHFQILHDQSNISLLNTAGYVRRFVFNTNVSCVSLFFMTSGAVLLNKPFDMAKHAKRLYRIIFQFIAWYLITTIFMILFGVVNITDYNITDFINHLFLSELPGIPYGHYWFIFTLIGIYLLLPFFYNSFADNGDKYKAIKILMLFLFICIFLSNEINTLIKVINVNVSTDNITKFIPFTNLNAIMIFFFILGGYIHKQYHKLKNIPIAYLVIVYLSGLLLLFIKFYIESSKIGSYDPIWSGYGSIGNLLMSASLFILVMRIDTFYEKISTSNSHSFIKLVFNVIQMVGMNTLAIFYIHEIIGTIVMPYVYSIAPYCGITINFAKAIIMVVLFSLIGEIIKKIPLLNKILT